MKLLPRPIHVTLGTAYLEYVEHRLTLGDPLFLPYVLNCIEDAPNSARTRWCLINCQEFRYSLADDHSTAKTHVMVSAEIPMTDNAQLTEYMLKFS